MSDSLSFEEFGRNFWTWASRQPLYSMTKKGWEIAVINEAIQVGLVQDSPAEIARTFRVSVSRAKSYLSELALRQEPISDREALSAFGRHLRESEVKFVDSTGLFIIQLNDLRLVHWAERKLSQLQLQAGESLRADTLKITPLGLANLLESVGDSFSPADALKELRKSFAETPWFFEAQKHVNPARDWKETISLMGDGTAIAREFISAAVMLFA